MKLNRPRGTRDFSPDEMRERDFVEGQIGKVFKGFNYSKIKTPTFEHLELFRLKSGEEIGRSMYLFEDKSKRMLCLRPEATASVCRMFAGDLRTLQRPLRLYYYGPMFRYEEPQKGRYREFWQMGAELIGSDTPESDAEIILMASESLKKLKLDFRLEINHRGIIYGLLTDLKVEPKKQDEIIACIDKGDEKKLGELIDSDALFALLELNDGKGAEILGNAEKLLAKYPSASGSLLRLKEVVSILDYAGAEYSINLGIARGLEYYTGMVFEIRVKGLGAENQICGGGRYDNLIELFGGPKTPAVGFAFGFDRVVEAMKAQGIEFPHKCVDMVIAPVNDEVRKDAMKIASLLREKYVVDVDIMGRKLDKIMAYANGINAKYVAVIGPRELKENKLVLKNMKTGVQETLSLKDVLEKAPEN